jgi:hypothetical protein
VNAVNAIDDIIATLEERRKEYNDAIDRAIAAVRKSETKTPAKAAPEHDSAQEVQNRATPKGRVKKGSLLDRALHILRATTGPMHVSNILKLMEDDTVERSHLVSVLERAIKREIVTRPKPATYAVVEGK